MRKDGSILDVEVLMVPLEVDGERLGFYAIYHDITELQAARREADAANQPLSGGPFKEFLAGLHRIQADFPEDASPIRTALVTARSAPAHERVIRTLRAWNIRIDEAFFLGGLDKGDVLRAFGADIFFDDQRTHIEAAARHGAAGHVPHGVANER